MSAEATCPNCGTVCEVRSPGTVFEVTGWNGKPLGLRFGAENRRIFVDPAWSVIHLELDGVVRLVDVTDAFWRDCPEFRSQSIEAWLKKHRLFPWPDHHPPKIRVQYLGGDVFRAMSPEKQS
jgi:hypothetical protein